MKINPDFVVFITMIGSAIIGFAFGRFERKDSYLRGYNRGKQVGKAMQIARDYSPYELHEVGRNESK